MYKNSAYLRAVAKAKRAEQREAVLILATAALALGLVWALVVIYTA